MNVTEPFGETTDYDKKLTLETKKPKAGARALVSSPTPLEVP